MNIRYVLHESHRSTYECGSCSAVVMDMAAHTRWHERVIAMSRRTPLVFDGPIDRSERQKEGDHP